MILELKPSRAETYHVFLETIACKLSSMEVYATARDTGRAICVYAKTQICILKVVGNKCIL